MPDEVSIHPAPAGGIQYKVVELSTVSDQEIEAALNRTVALGYRFESLHFAMWEGSKRPSMAFLIFTKPETVQETVPQKVPTQ